MRAPAALRSSELQLRGFFGYVAIISLAFPHDPRSPALPLGLAFGVPALLAALAYGEARVHREFFSIARDWVPLALTLVAYREMDWFSPLVRDHHLEHRWILWDRWLLYDGGLQRGIEALGSIGPTYFEFCYLLVYAVGPFAVAVLYFARRRERKCGVPIMAGHAAPGHTHALGGCILPLLRRPAWRLEVSDGCSFLPLNLCQPSNGKFAASIQTGCTERCRYGNREG